MKGLNMDKVIVVLSTISVYDFLHENETDTEAITRAEKFYTEDFELVTQHFNDYGSDYWEREVKVTKEKLEKGFKVMLFDDYLKMQKAHLISGEPEEITAEHFEEMLDVLPPLKWCTIDGVEMFCMSEMTTGTYTQQYAHDKTSEKYYTKLVDICDKSTWINTYLR